MNDAPMASRPYVIAAVIVAVALLLPAGALARSQAVATGTGGAPAGVAGDGPPTASPAPRQGANAIAAAVAATATLGVPEPYVAGLGGGGFMTIYVAREHKVITIDGRETAPQSFPRDAFIDPQTGQPIPFSPQRITSGMAVRGPGTLAPRSHALARSRTMPLSQLL